MRHFSQLVLDIPSLISSLVLPQFALPLFFLFLFPYQPNKRLAFCYALVFSLPCLLLILLRKHTGHPGRDNMSKQMAVVVYDT